MKWAMETIGASATAPGTGAAMTAVAGDSLRVRDASAASLLSVSTNFQAVGGGTLRITSPLLHDNTVGINQRTIAAQKGYWAVPARQSLTPQDTLTLNAVGSAVAGDVETAALTVMYEDLAGIDGALIMTSELRSRAVELFCPRVNVTTTGAGWTGTVSLTALDDQYKANEEYAWLGVCSDAIYANAHMLGMVSPDWGNLRIACPLDVGPVDVMTQYYCWLSDQTGKPTIPIFNASQKSNINVSVLGNENVSAFQGVLVLARLVPRGRR